MSKRKTTDSPFNSPRSNKECLDVITKEDFQKAMALVTDRLENIQECIEQLQSIILSGLQDEDTDDTDYLR